MKLTIKGIQYEQTEEGVSYDLSKEEVEDLLLDLGVADLTDNIKENAGGLLKLVMPFLRSQMDIPKDVEPIDYMLSQAIEYGLTSWEEKGELVIERKDAHENPSELER